MSPIEREALDWCTLGRLCGWDVRLRRPEELDAELADACQSHWIVVAGDPDGLSRDALGALRRIADTRRVCIVSRAGARASGIAGLASTHRNPETMSGRSLAWHGPGDAARWTCADLLCTPSMAVGAGARVWATLDGSPVVAATARRQGTIVSLAWQPSEARDAEGAVTALLRHLLVSSSPASVDALDLRDTMVLRMDDPGSCERVYRTDAFCTALGEAEWIEIERVLRRHDARLSVGYVSGWVDDGQASAGRLLVSGRRVRRVPGGVHPSPAVTYEVRRGPHKGAVIDYEGDYAGIRALERSGRVSVELHGHTHVHPDTRAWSRAADRHQAVRWYRELGEGASAAIGAVSRDEHPLTLGLARLRDHFSSDPTTLICPGDEWTNEVLEYALDLGLELVGSYYLALREGDRFCWATHVCAPYLDQADARWLDSGLPVVGYFHDFDVIQRGVGWFERCLSSWRQAGVRRFIDYRGLADALAGRRRTIARLPVR
jgi:hypothetical protein